MALVTMRGMMRGHSLGALLPCSSSNYIAASMRVYQSYTITSAYLVCVEYNTQCKEAYDIHEGHACAEGETTEYHRHDRSELRLDGELVADVELVQILLQNLVSDGACEARREKLACAHI